MKEKILCAAVNFNGVIIPGFRHVDCYDVLIKLGIKYVDEEQGFLTSYNRFVSRREAWIIAKKNNQISPEILKQDYLELISEDLY